MKPQLLKVTNTAVNSFSIRKDTVPYINNHWHYHSEVELIYFKKGTGTQFIGDSVKRFQSGDLVLVGSYLPHYWRFDDIYFEKEVNACADVSVIHFTENFWGSDFLNLPENKLLKTTLDNARRGIQISGGMAENIAEVLDNLLQAEGPYKIIHLMDALCLIGTSQHANQLSSIGFNYHFEETDTNRINAIYEYSMSNFKSQIRLEEIARVASISPNSFCRFFKSRTGKTYVQFLTEIRIGNACKLLIEEDINLKQVCYESGFNNFSSFHKFFKQITGKSPAQYQREFVMQSRRLQSA